MSRSNQVTLVCKTCGKVYSKAVSQVRSGRLGHFCSVACYNAFRVQPVTVTCQTCGSEFQVWRSRFERGNVKFCSNKCSRVARVDILRSANPNPPNKVMVRCETCGKEFLEIPSRIKQNSRFCSRACYGTWRKKSGIAAGENNHCWRGGTSDRTIVRLRQTEWRKLADEIRSQRGNVCEICGATSIHKLPVHHVIPWEVSHDDSPENLLVVCSSRHATLDQIYQSQGLAPYRSTFA